MDQHELVSRLKAMALELGKTPSRDEFVNTLRGGQRAVTDAFGSYSAFVQASGLAPAKARTPVCARPQNPHRPPRAGLVAPRTTTSWPCGTQGHLYRPCGTSGHFRNGRVAPKATTRKATSSRNPRLPARRWSCAFHHPSRSPAHADNSNRRGALAPAGTFQANNSKK